MNALAVVLTLFFSMLSVSTDYCEKQGKTYDECVNYEQLESGVAK